MKIENSRTLPRDVVLGPASGSFCLELPSKKLHALRFYALDNQHTARIVLLAVSIHCGRTHYGHANSRRGVHVDRTGG
jgi:hypothetical protein